MADVTALEEDETVVSLERVQSYDLKALVRERELGEKFALREIVPPTSKVQNLFRQIAPSHVEYFPQSQKNIIQRDANSFFKFLEDGRLEELSDFGVMAM
jgi:hypothetical protein